MYVRLFLAALLLRGVLGAKILALMAICSRSHHLWNSRYLEALAKRGHQVTYFSTDKFDPLPKNINQITIENAYEVLHEGFDLSEVSSVGPYESEIFLETWNDNGTEFYVKSKGFQELKRLIRREKFDLVVHDFGGFWFLLGVVDVLGRPPVIGITAFSIPMHSLTVLGNPYAYASKPQFYSEYSNEMNFWQRANNYFIHLWCFGVHQYFLKKQDDQAKAAFGPDIRPLEDIMSDINIILVNGNPATDFPFPRVPGLITVGGLHIKEPKPLPQDLKTFLDEAKNGVVLFSLGTNVKSSGLRKERVNILLEAFRRLSPVRVLWKWESDSLPNKPENVKISKWLPQNDVLAHPNVRLFFTHSGLLSTQEAIYHGKPIVGMPFFLDQTVNVVKCKQRGLGEKLDVKSLTVDNVVATLRKVITDPKYTENARKASAVFRDELEHPLDRAVYWTEYAIRHKGAPHLRDSARDLSWYQNWLLDVFAMILFGAFAVFYFIYKVIAAIVCRKQDARKGTKLKRN